MKKVVIVSERKADIYTGDMDEEIFGVFDSFESAFDTVSRYAERHYNKKLPLIWEPTTVHRVCYISLLRPGHYVRAEEWKIVYGEKTEKTFNGNLG